MNKDEIYQDLLKYASSLFSDEDDLITRMANMSALLYMHLQHVNWAGFYRVRNQTLVLGPFQGKPACTPIPFGKGVCGTSAKDREIQCITNVHEFPGHIACDADSKSEIVIPLIKEDTLLGVLDIDSDQYATFDHVDVHYLSNLMAIMLTGDVH